MTTLVKTWKAAQTRLKDAGIDSPAIDARLLLEAAADVTRLDILNDPYRELTPDQVDRFDGWIARRLNREPVASILGRKAFWKIMLNVTPDVLTPRPDTETVVEVALSAFSEGMAFEMVDMGVGSGAILLSVLAERPAARGLGTDISEEALAVARDNAANLGLADRAAFLRTGWADGLADAGFDLVTSNPPYIRSEEIATLDPEVREHDPHLALDGGSDGLDAYRALVPETLRVLKPLGVFVVETGWNQAEQVQALFAEAGFENLRIVQDLGARDRVVTGTRPA
ncbi:MAG TPA: peptide chain release factor N(5)-glutamine methyltransferase [Brevundimonas sp.]|uniref:peptide chain release factor N(5)-glutamine methyltransferase n=1 Tax=Brevundimonas sp. TaxID=1871086 RepID=UPI002BC46AA2|nr:peptide chain release factor N(5)-glutamine methyltransferase [Brevundimonas sp.]HRH19139.1 peptide chain release factor N(5)-glutamine methyltransferase [Brevundimonas sp.]